MKNIFLTAFALLSLASCSNYLDDPNSDFTNNPFNSQLNPAKKLASAELNYLNHEVFNYNRYGNNMTYTYAQNFGFTGSDAPWNFDYTSKSYSFLFENSFLFTDNFQDIIDAIPAYPTYKRHAAIAKILKVQGMEKLINLYGDVPYSEAFNTNNLKPRYDDDKAILVSLLNLLDEARLDIANAPSDPTLLPVGAEDIVFKGNMGLWAQYANTIELRMLLKLSNTTDASLITLRNDRFALLNNNFITNDVSYNPGFTGNTTAQSNPLFRLYGTIGNGGDETTSFLANAAGDFPAKIINGIYNSPELVTTGLIDPRRIRMFNLKGTRVKGALQNVNPASEVSRLSVFINGNVGAFGFKNGSERDAYAMLAAESYFLQAEAAERGYIIGDSHALFDQGITASFDFYNRSVGAAVLPVLNSATYITNIDTRIGLGWTASPNKISAIMTQKYLALTQWTGIEPYFDFLRTGFPVIPLPEGVTLPNRANRLMYPSSEYSSNSANVPNVTKADLFTINAKTPYYLQ